MDTEMTNGTENTMVPRICLNDILGPRFEPHRARLVRLLGTRDVLRLSQTCREVQQAFRSREWNINSRLARFFDDPRAFRAEIGHCNALITGSFVLEFFARTVSPGDHLKILVQKGQDADRLEACFLSVGYQLTNVNSSFETQERTLIKHGTNGAVTILYLYMSGTKIPLDPVLNSPTSDNVNFISWNKAISVYAKLTFVKHDSVLLAPRDMVSEGHLDWLGRHGWRMQTRISAVRKDLADFTQQRSDTVAVGHRRVGDILCWTMPLDTTSVVRPSVPAFVLESSRLAITPPPAIRPNELYGSWSAFNEGEHFTIHTKTLSSHVLRYKYTFGYTDRDDGKYFTPWEEVQGHCNISLLGQLWKLGANERKRLTDGKTPAEVLSHLNVHELDKPEGWDYFDDELTDLIERLWRQMIGRNRYPTVPM
ncbi:Uu.00g022860.m01.CDS01 [Anthostomella pinea]|uniref:Uu.00g022860.m01.CDS01 n=1 Tax=Anthostomella pinea TaxID=933095 RepID=A0AAI8W009_9PEZI|nr:Uu.00g022860.m01.CDS01 [Anthostomella pinea]